MERLGISSACYYPLTTEESFLKVCKAGIKCVELFFNSPSELSVEFISQIKKMQNEYDVSIPSVHPFMSFAESFFLFSSYERRFFDILDLYKRFFEIMNDINSDIFILHGSKIPGSISDELYVERFAKLIETGKSFNVEVCQENVVDYRSQTVDYVEKMKNIIGSDFGMVLDIKQARRAGQNTAEFINRLGKFIKHVHISDYNEKSTCIPPCEGYFDFNLFFESMKSIGYNGKYIIELYNHSYTNEEQIYTSYKKINYSLIINLLYAIISLIK